MTNTTTNDNPSAALTRPTLALTQPTRRRRLPYPIAMAVLCVLAWAVPVILAASRLTWLLPLLILVATASLLRVGSTLLDRVVVAMALLLGAVCLGGVVLSVWPWALAPVPVAGTALTALVVVAAWLRRPPHLPRPGAVDVACALVGAAAMFVAGRPYLRGDDFAGRLAIAGHGEDIARHLSVVQAVGDIGGYLFLSPDAAAALVHKGMVFYPQGWHLLTALLERFVAPGGVSGFAALDLLLVFHVATYGLFGLVLAWALCWVGGPLVRTGGRLVLVVVALGAMLTMSDLIRLVVSGYPAQMLGLTLLALLIALLARPISQGSIQLIVVTSLVAALGFAYYVYLPVALAAVAIWVWRRWKRLETHRVIVRWCGAVVAVSTIPALLGMYDHQADGLTHTGTPPLVGRNLLVAALLVILAGTVTTRSGRRSPVWRAYALAAAPALVAALALGAFQLVAFGTTGYYFDKLLAAAEVALLVGVGSAARLLPPPPRHPRTASTRIGAAGPSVLAAAAVIALMGGLTHDSVLRSGTPVTWGTEWYKGMFRIDELAETTLRVMAEHPPRPEQSVFVLTDNAYLNYAVPLWIAVLRGVSGGEQDRGQYSGFLPGVGPVAVSGLLLSLDGPVLVVTTTPGAAALLREFLAQHPGRLVEHAVLTASAPRQ